MKSNIMIGVRKVYLIVSAIASCLMFALLLFVWRVQSDVVALGRYLRRYPSRGVRGGIKYIAN